VANFVVVHGSYKLDVPCPGCGAEDGWRCWPGEWPKCWRCGVIVLLFGRTPKAKCVSPNGRIDGHMSYVNGRGNKCAFCGKSWKASQSECNDE